MNEHTCEDCGGQCDCGSTNPSICEGCQDCNDELAEDDEDIDDDDDEA